MNVLHVCESVKGGVATYINELAKISQYSSDINCKYFLPAAEVPKKFILENEVFDSKYKKRTVFNSFVFIYRLNRVLAENNWDIVHVHGSIAGFVVRFLTFLRIYRFYVVYTTPGWACLSAG